MREWISRSILALEVWFLLVPLTYVVGLYSILLSAAYLGGNFIGEPAEAHFMPAAILIGAIALGFGWYACLGFLIRGRSWLARLGRPVVQALYFGTALATLGTISYAVDYSNSINNQIAEALNHLEIFIFGVPAILPFIHLETERRFAKARATTQQ